MKTQLIVNINVYNYYKQFVKNNGYRCGLDNCGGKIVCYIIIEIWKQWQIIAFENKYLS